MPKLLTIVVPVYKVEPYINKCLDSCILYRQDAQGNRVIDEDLMSLLEVIIVNDGTPDRSAEMSREYTLRYPQTFHQIDKENGGHGSAWNVGLREATGKYLRFLDSDDWLTNLDKLMLALSRTDADLVFTHHNTHFAENNTDIVNKAEPPYNKLLDVFQMPVERFAREHFHAGFQYVTYKAKILKAYYPLFTEGTRYDDTILFVLPVLKGRTYLACDFILYNYLIGREEQTVSDKNMQKFCNQYCYEYGKMYDFAMRNTKGSSVQDIVDAILSGTFYRAMNLSISLPYKRRKICIDYLKKYIPQDNICIFSKAIKRYLNMPFVLAYLWDILRAIKNG